MTDPRRLTAYFGSGSYPGEIAALEGNRGHMRVRFAALETGKVAAGDEGELEMHDGARFRVRVVEPLEAAGEYRLKLLGRGAGT